MDTIIEYLLKIFPFEEWLIKQYNLTEKQAAGIAFLMFLAFAAAVVKLFKFVYQFWEEHKLLQKSKDLKPQWDFQMVQKAKQYYIPTQYQNASPARQEEPGFTHQYVARNPLIPFFINQAFNEKADSERFYLILADSGMGKTTFMINLYLEYHSVFNRKRNGEMRLFRFSHPDTLSEIEAIKAKGIDSVKNTILLLDALDEDPYIVSKDPKISDERAFRRRLDEIIDATRNFCEVVITCRTQYFPGQEDDPYELKIKRSDERGYYTLNKLYISPFTDEEVSTYLKKKFGKLPFINRTKKQRANQVITRSRHLVMRPMMLSYIDYLVEDNRTYHTAFEIYETLVEKWLIREGEKRRNSNEREAFIQNLEKVSLQAAIEIYWLWQFDNRMFLTKSEAVSIATKNQIDLKPEEVTGQSLLTCDGAGNWKFAHKSIMEFFLAKALLSGNIPMGDTTLGGMDMAKQFFIEKNTIPLMLFVPEGLFTMGSPEDEPERGTDEGQHKVTIRNFFLSACPVTLGQFEIFVQETNYQTDADKGGGSSFSNGKEWKLKSGVNWRCDVNGVPQNNKHHPVIHVSWNDAQAYCAWLSNKQKASYRLPTESEWEYVCRAGTKTPFYTGDYITSKQANFDGTITYNNSPKGIFLKRTSPVGTYLPNPWGFYDMIGNVWEWCSDDWHDSYDGAPDDGSAWVDNPRGAIRVLRGGSWYFYPRYCRAAYRNSHRPDTRNNIIGFRLALSFQ